MSRAHAVQPSSVCIGTEVAQKTMNCFEETPKFHFEYNACAFLEHLLTFSAGIDIYCPDACNVLHSATSNENVYGLNMAFQTATYAGIMLTACDQLHRFSNP